jgi:hypothetical protein
MPSWSRIDSIFTEQDVNARYNLGVVATKSFSRDPNATGSALHEASELCPLSNLPILASVMSTWHLLIHQVHR